MNYSKAFLMRIVKCTLNRFEEIQRQECKYGFEILGCKMRLFEGFSNTVAEYDFLKVHLQSSLDATLCPQQIAYARQGFTFHHYLATSIT